MLFTPEMSGLLDRDREPRGAARRRRGRRTRCSRAVREAAARPAHLGRARLARGGARDDGRWANRSLLIAPDGARRRALRQDPHVRRRAGERRELARIGGLCAGRGGGRRRNAARPARSDGVLRRPLSRAVRGAWPPELRRDRNTRGVHRADRQGALAPAASAPARSRRAPMSSPPRRPGEHADGRRTYGHSLVVDPWGEVVLDMGGERRASGFADDRSRTHRRGPRPAAQPCQQAGKSLHRAHMIVFDLNAAPAATGSKAGSGPPSDFAEQQASGLVAARVRLGRRSGKAPMAPRLAAQGQPVQSPRRRRGQSDAGGRSLAAAKMPPEAARDAARAGRRCRRERSRTRRWVGDRFAEQSRAMHYGERDPETIHGQATPDEARRAVRGRHRHGAAAVPGRAARRGQLKLAGFDKARIGSHKGLLVTPASYREGSAERTLLTRWRK